MESLNERISDFLSLGGSGYGSGSGYGTGTGYCDGYGYGTGYGSGDGYGDGNGSGSGTGTGYGDGYGSGLKTYNNHPVHYIDGVATVIRSAFKNAARGYVINSDLTTKDCVILKSGNIFAHGDTFADAESALQEKLFDVMDPDEKIGMFREKFEDGVKYPAREFYDWHHRLTGSCEFGRKSFARDHEIDLDADTYTVREFIEITKDAYGGEIIRCLEEYYTK